MKQTVEDRSLIEKRKFDSAMQKVKHLVTIKRQCECKSILTVYDKLNQLLSLNFLAAQQVTVSLMCLLLIGLVLVQYGVEATWKKEKGKGDFKIWLAYHKIKF